MGQRFIRLLIVPFLGIIVIVIGVIVYIGNTNLIEVMAALVSVGTATILTFIAKLFDDGELYYNKVAGKAYKRLKYYAKTVRYNHTLLLVLKDATENTVKGRRAIKVEGVHKYELKNVSWFKPIDEHMEIYTDIGRQENSRKGGFEKIYIDGKELPSSEVRSSKGEKGHKKYFEYPLKIQRNGKRTFEYHTSGIFFSNDRLIWTVQDLSQNFEITVVNKTSSTVKTFDTPEKDISNEIIFKINHDQENEIKIIPEHRIISEKVCEDVYTINFGFEVLPYQGFEMSWDFKKNV